MKYVLFREDNLTHKEVYLRIVDKEDHTVTRKVEEALWFDSAATAYFIATRFILQLQWWRVGLR